MSATEAWLVTVKALLCPPTPLPHPLLCHPAFTNEALGLFRTLVPDAKTQDAFEELVTAVASLWKLAPEPHTLQPQLLDTSRLLDLADAVTYRLPKVLPLPSKPSTRHLFASDLWEATSRFALRQSALGAEGLHAAQAATAQVAFFRVWRRLVPDRVTAFGAHQPFVGATQFLEAETVPHWDGAGALLSRVGDYGALRPHLHPRVLALLTEASAHWEGPPTDFDAHVLRVLARATE